MGEDTCVVYEKDCNYDYDDADMDIDEYRKIHDLYEEFMDDTDDD